MNNWYVCSCFLFETRITISEKHLQKPTDFEHFWLLRHSNFVDKSITFWNKNDANFGRDFWSILLDCLVAFGPFWEPKLLQNRCSFLSEFWYQNLIDGWSVLAPFWLPFGHPFGHRFGIWEGLESTLGRPWPWMRPPDPPGAQNWPILDPNGTILDAQLHHFGAILGALSPVLRSLWAYLHAIDRFSNNKNKII